MTTNRTRAEEHLSQHKTFIRRNLLRWFVRHKRDLPWRHEPRNPYHVWVSEIMLQQTQVATVIPYFERWLRKFPTISDLAAADLGDVLKLWEGLGYYSRARNLHMAAIDVVARHGGDLPRTIGALVELRGIGRYTAGAIASLAFGECAAAVDGNVRRIFKRVFGLHDAPDDFYWRLAELLLPARKAGAFNEALMDLGATVCKPKNPSCAQCPLKTKCVAYQTSDVTLYAQFSKPKLPTRTYKTFVLIWANCVLVQQRPQQGLLGGLWEFPNFEVLPNADATELPQPYARATTPMPLFDVRHAFTHFKQVRHVCVSRIRRRKAVASNQQWANMQMLNEIAMSRSDRKIFNELVLRRLIV
jgi:A/G-specific adenine glycosylase